MECRPTFALQCLVRSLTLTLYTIENTIMQGMVAGERIRGKPRQRWEKDITDAFGTMATASRMAEDMHRFRKDSD